MSQMPTDTFRGNFNYHCETLGYIASLVAATIYLVNRDYKLWNMYKLRDIYTPYADAAGMLLHIYMWKVHNEKWK
jgi:hypothetical protein